MKRSFRALFLCLLTAAMLTVTASADMGPKPQLIVRVENAPAELYYLDILEEGEYADASHPFDGIEWSYSQEEAAALDRELLAALQGAIPDGWHGCTAEGSTGAPMWGDLYPEEMDDAGNPLHTFGYHGVPETYRILMVTKSGETFLSDVCQRQALQCSATVDWAAKTVTTPPVMAGYVLQFLSTLLPTLALELLILALFRLVNRKNLRVFLLVNLVTQGVLALFFSFNAVRQGVGFMYILLFVPAELVILLAESFAYRRWLSCGKGRATAYAVTANLASAVVGFVIMEPVWRFVVSIS